MAIKYKVGDLTSILEPAYEIDRGRLVRVIRVGLYAEDTVKLEPVYASRDRFPPYWSPARLGPVISAKENEYGEVCP